MYCYFHISIDLEVKATFFLKSDHELIDHQCSCSGLKAADNVVLSLHQGQSNL